MNKLKLFLLIFCCYFVSGNVLNAQKAKFKNQKVTVQKTRLPQNFVKPEDRTYNLYKTGSYSSNIDVFDKGIYGWTVNDVNPNLEAAVSIYGFTIGGAKRKSEKKEKKNKEGKVVERWTEYTYTGTATGKGTLYIYGASNPFQYNQKEKKKSKYEEKKEAEAAAKKKELEDNPFLSSEDVEEAAESDISEDKGLDGAQLPLVKTVSLDVSKSATTGKHRSSAAAYKEYSEKKRPTLYSFKSRYPQDAYNKAINTLNYNYGYSPVNYKVYLKKLKSEKHPEFKKWNSACTAAQTLYKPFRYNKSIDANQAKFDPIIAYFADIISSIPEKDRKAKKMKKAAFNNLTNILYYLDRYEAVLKICDKYKESKDLDRDAKKMTEKTKEQIALMAFHNATSCHFASLGDINEDDIEEEGSDDDGEN